MKYSAFLIAFFTTMVQCYDYALFGLSASVLSKTFMPNCSDEEQLLRFFAVFGVAVIGRPLGSIIFGKIADSYGRVTSLKIAAGLAALTTATIGMMPSFESIGWYATFMLTLCRIIFLMSLAGEIDATRIYVVEKIGKHHRNFASGITSFCNQFGGVIAAISYHYAEKSEISNLWRANFIVGGIIGILILLMRKYFQESEEFLLYQLSKVKKSLNLGLLEIIKQNKINFMLSLLISGCGGGIYHFLIIFFGTFSAKVTYLITLKESGVLNISLISAYSIAALVSGFVADRLNPKKQIIVSLSLSLLVVCAVQLILIEYQIAAIYMISILACLMPFYTIPLHIIIQSSFTVDIRVRMCSLSHSLGGMIFSATTPFFSTLIWQYTHSLQAVITWLMLLLMSILTGSILLNKE